MQRKTYRSGILMVLFGMLILPNGYAQQTPAVRQKPGIATEQKDYQQQLKALQQNMADLQQQMLELRQQHIKETRKQNADNRKELHLMSFDTIHDFVHLDSLRTFTKALASNISTSISGINSAVFLQDGVNYNSVNINKRESRHQDLIEKIKTYSKSYAVDKNDKLIIDNQYGRVMVNTWNKNEFKVDVEIRVGTANEAESQKLLDDIAIIATHSQDGVSFKTNIENRDHNSNHNRSTSVNYTVFMPVKNALEITNRFGAVILPDLEGPVTIRNSYGSFVAKELSNTANDIRIKFGSANIGALNGGNLDFAYGNLKIGTASNLNATMGFSPVNIEYLKSSANIKVQYGSGLKINNLDKSLKNLDIDASFTTVSVDLNGTENFLFDVTVKHNQFNYNDNRVKILNPADNDGEQKYNFTKNYKGYVGKSGSGNKVTIKSNYQPVSFN